ncbi:MAG: hypothetical protein Athens101428_272 [Candidatus Berkelbacteria bacterium Athens1014_28]|uniref:Uncharacterized protein n=1 Tax=Candidatus Berkelbacteria bacterium Athens1014_28 TaxID=2017145 RepID=A0A554LNJ3_9BACT|nr:MAG: hypothetical protein Athens101428_272 [Candidatus Berkelbacteria bacterium Athens1014_28]
MTIENFSLTPEINKYEIEKERNKIRGFVFLGIFTGSLEESSSSDLRDAISEMSSDEELDEVNGDNVNTTDHTYLHLDVPAREYEKPQQFILDFARSVDMLAGCAQAIPSIQYVYGASYLSRYATRFGFQTAELPEKSKKAEISRALYVESKGEEKAEKIPKPMLAYISATDLLQARKSERAKNDETTRVLGDLTIIHKRFIREQKRIVDVLPEEMADYCCGNTLKIEINPNVSQKEMIKSFDMLVGYVSTLPSIWNVYIINPEEHEELLGEIGFLPIEDENCSGLLPKVLVASDGGKFAASIVELKDWGVETSGSTVAINPTRSA